MSAATIPLAYYLILAAALFVIGLYGVLAQRNAIVALMSVELMLSGVNINLVAFDRYLVPASMTGQIFAIFTVTVAAAEVCLGLAIVIALARRHATVNLKDFDSLKG